MTAEVAEIAKNLALNCAYRVFPCRTEDKRPATPHGFKDSECEPAAIARLWRRFPGGLIGVETGERSGVSILDIDVKHDPARAWWHQNAARLPLTRAYRTRSGGLHLVFRHVPGVRNVEGKPIQGVDVRGQGGYFIFWFATGLECVDHAPTAPWPAWLTALFWPPPLKPKVSTAGRSFVATDGHLERVIDRALDRVRVAGDGQKHHRLRSSARLLGGIQSRVGFTDEQAITWLLDALPAGVRSEDGARKTAEWGLDKGRSAPLPGCS